MDVRGYVFNIATFLDMQEMDSSSEEADTSIQDVHEHPRTTKVIGRFFEIVIFIPPVPQGLVLFFDVVLQ